VGFIELLEKTKGLSEEQTEFVNSLQSSTVSLMSIINDVLDYTKLEAGKMVMEAIPFDPVGVCKGCLEVIAAVSEKKGLDVQSLFGGTTRSDTSAPMSGAAATVLIPPHGHQILGDPNRIRQVLLNLLSNAVKFTQRGEIKLSLTAAFLPGRRIPRRNDDESTKSSRKNTNDDDDDDEEEDPSSSTYVLQFSVSDSGVGISKDHFEHIFQKFRQTDASVSRHYGGTGLGLSICKTLVEAMGGTLRVKSEINKGSEFVFDIPVQLSARTDVPSLENPKVLSSKAAASHTEARGLQGLEILVAEDNLVNQRLVAAMLKRGGYKPTIVGNGKLAVEALEPAASAAGTTPANGKSCKYAIILMDVQMPVMDGIEATRLIRSKGWTKEMLPIVGLTASFQTAELASYQEMGMNDCIGKPVRLDALNGIIHRLVNLSLETEEKV
jgi:CheY-like chemotaxis protein